MISNFYRKKLDELLADCRRNITSVKINENLITNAFRFALEAHKNDRRASGEPYISHPYEVAMILANEMPIDDISVAAALLHDVVEDTRFTTKDIRAEFGDEVAEIVEGATQIEGIFENYEVKALESFKKLLLSMTSDIRTILVKFADRLHNLRTLDFLPPSRQVRIAQETLEIFAPFAHRFGLSNIKTEMEDLSFKYLNKQVYDEIARKLKERKKERDRFIKKIVEPIGEALKKENYKFEINGRAKHIYSIYRKMMSRNKSFDEIYDLFAVRVILDTDNKYDCFSVYGIISEIFIPVPERFKDYISIPKQNGYQSIHTTVVSKEGKLVELQIRTREMHEVAEKGIAAHWKYKENIKISDKKIDEWMKWIRETIENAGKEDYSSRQLMESFKMNLYQDEIYLFTPKGELKILPKGSTPVDFAFEIHTEVGMRCIGAKVNGKIISLDTPLKSGSQVEILTSKNQTPKRDWEKFVVTQKAKSDIRKYFNNEKRSLAEKGKEIFEKKLKKNKLHINEDDLTRLVHKMKFRDILDFYYEVGINDVRADDILNVIQNKSKQELVEITADNAKEPDDEIKIQEKTYNKFIADARATAGGISLGGGQTKSNIPGLKYDFAKCCNPIPGDDVIGYITKTEGIKIHRRNCNNIVNLYLMDASRIVDVNWGESGLTEFPGGVRITGEDRPGILNELTEMISKNYKINIISVNIFTKGTMFEGTIILNVHDLKELNSVIDKIRMHKGVVNASRYNG
jgi:RelA/SpoT family (p)ppGpp synthetase